MSKYADLDATIGDIVKYAVHAVMRRDHWYGQPGGPYTFVVSNYQTVTVAGPGGAPTGTVTLGERYTYPGGTEKVRVNPTTEVYEPWEAQIRAAFEPWMPTALPDPAGFGDVINTCARAAVHLNGDGAQLDDKGLDPNPNLGDYGRAVGLLDQMSGQTVGEFSRLYMHRLPANIGAQCQAAIDITEGLLGEQRIWIETQKSVASIADGALEAMKAAADSGGGAAKAFLTVVGVALSIASIYATGGWAAGLAYASVGQGLLSDAIPDGAKQEKGLGGGSPEEVHSRLKEALTQLNTDVKGEEQKLVDEFDRLQRQISTGGEAWNVEPPASMQQAASEADFGTVTKVVSDQLREIGDVLLPNVAAQFSAAATLLNPHTGAGEWWRYGSIGVGAAGPYYHFEGATIALATLLLDNKKELVDAGEQLAIAAGYFDRTDQAVHDDLVAHNQKVAASPGVPQIPWNPPPQPPRVGGQPIPE